jgi:hypothetical protein
MRSFTEKQLRDSFINTSLKERKTITMPEVDTISWDSLDFLGWRDRKVPNLGYVVIELDDVPTGILLRQADARARSRPQCSWCEDVTLPNDVVGYSVKRTGQAGRDGNTIGTLACANFECSANVRKAPPVAYLGFDVEAARQRRIQALGEHVRGFVRDVRDGA